MDKRTALAFILVAFVIVGGQLLAPKPPPRRAADTAAPAGAVAPAPAPSAVSAASTPVERDSTDRTVAAPASVARPDSLNVNRGAAAYTFVSPGAVPARVALTSYKDLSPRRGTTVAIAQPDRPLLGMRFVAGGDTLWLQRLAMRGTVSGNRVRYESTQPAVTVEYEAAESGYLTHVRGTAPPGTSTVLIDLPETLASFEADTADDQRHHAYGYKSDRTGGGDITSIPFTKLDSTRFRTDSGPLRWVATRNKYFLLALVAPDSSRAFLSLRMRGGHRAAKDRSSAFATAAAPVRDGQFAFDLYAGPQSWAQLRAVGNELENVNPYAGMLHSVAQPFVTIVMRILLWLKATLQVNYGWVLVIFGVMLRVLMWPLNQSAMRSSIKMQRIQPELQAVQKKYANDPEGQRQALMKLYAAHGMSPLSPLLGCLPMLLPMPVLFALYFVFQNTIEFRGVPFLWLPDLALRDPYYITPVFMGVSMFVLSWISMRSAPPNPQAKIMSYTMPVMMTFIFLNFASGLNVYYGVQNLVAIPQQWLLTRERARSTA